MHSPARCATRSNATGLTEFNIANNLIEGAIPDSVRHLRYLQRFNVQNTMMFCCNGTKTCNGPGDLDCLPAFLQFDDSIVRPPYDFTTWVQSNETGANMK